MRRISARIGAAAAALHATGTLAHVGQGPHSHLEEAGGAALASGAWPGLAIMAAVLLCVLAGVVVGRIPARVRSR